MTLTQRKSQLLYMRAERECINEQRQFSFLFGNKHEQVRI